MKTSDVFPSRFVAAEDLHGDTKVTIADVRLEEVFDQKSGGQVKKPVVYFDKATKGLLLNKTNWSAIANQHGDDTALWTGKEVTLIVVTVEAFGEVVDAIRIKSNGKK